MFLKFMDLYDDPLKHNIIKLEILENKVIIRNYI